MKTDREIHADVVGALKFDPQIKEQNIAGQSTSASSPNRY